MGDTTIRLYHGSNTIIERPETALNSGFADLGKGFYLTPDLEAARGRATTRARREGGQAVVSVFELRESCVPWVTWGERIRPQEKPCTSTPFGLSFEETPQGFAAWAAYIDACRHDKTEVPGVGSPAIVRAWLATMEIEMACSGFITAEEFAQSVDPDELTIQYCVLDQGVLDKSLRFVGTQALPPPTGPRACTRTVRT